MTVPCPAVTDPSPRAGWYPDPLGRHQHRYHNGTAWTPDVADDGQRYVDPFGIGPSYAPGGAGRQPPGNRIATAAMTCGLIGMFLAWIPFVVVAGLTLGVLALVFGSIGLRRAQAAGRGRGFAITGVLSGIAALALSAVGIALSVQVYREFDAFIRPGPVTTEIAACRTSLGAARVDGTLTNDDDEVHDYTLFVSLPGHRTVIEIDAVPPGETVTWVATLPTELRSCEPTVDVQGPFPYDIAIDPIDDE